MPKRPAGPKIAIHQPEHRSLALNHAKKGSFVVRVGEKEGSFTVRVAEDAVYLYLGPESGKKYGLLRPISQPGPDVRWRITDRVVPLKLVSAAFEVPAEYANG